jgi:hypothetical protein
MDKGVMAATTAAVRRRRRRVKYIRASVTEVGDQLREMSGLVSFMFRASFFFIMGACLLAAPVAYISEQHQIADLLLFSGSFLFFAWIAAKWLRRALISLFRGLRGQAEAELALLESAAHRAVSGTKAPGRSKADPDRDG